MIEFAFKIPFLALRTSRTVRSVTPQGGAMASFFIQILSFFMISVIIQKPKDFLSSLCIFMKKIFFSLFLAFLLTISFSSVFAVCTYDGNGSVQGALSGCAPQGSITAGDYTISWGVKGKVIQITNQLIIAGSILSVGGIVLSAILYVSALGDGEKVKKAKTALQYSALGFVLMLLSFPIVNMIVNLIYGIR